MFTSRTQKGFISVALLSTALMLMSLLTGCAPDEQNPIKATVNETQTEIQGDDIEVKQLITAVEQAIRAGRNPETDFQFRALLDKIGQVQTPSSTIASKPIFTLDCIWEDPCCSPKGDLNTDGFVTDFELLNYINQWNEGKVGDLDVLDAIDNWNDNQVSVNIVITRAPDVEPNIYYFVPINENFPFTVEVITNGCGLSGATIELTTHNNAYFVKSGNPMCNKMTVNTDNNGKYSDTVIFEPTQDSWSNINETVNIWADVKKTEVDTGVQRSGFGSVSVQVISYFIINP